MPRFEFDPGKSRSNKERHGVDLEWSRRLWDETHVILPAKNINGENRHLILAKVRGRCYAAIFAMRGEIVRLISCHRADRRLERIYEGQIQGQEN